MAKRKSATKAKKSWYKVATYGIKFDSMTFLIMAVFVLVVAVLLVAKMF